ncbi:hypothetical protein [Kitasatospora cinereorecta]|uniref:DUF1877 family protein n=1 Tax=Kitasatospora cinereorecta TaxID=285560 RepID=A0ABW0VKY0_9ACTN
MGVLTDWFRAADAESVVAALIRSEGGSPLGGPGAGFAGVEAKHVDPTVLLGQLVAAVRRIPWQLDLVATRTVWPTGPAPGPDGPAEEDDPWLTGPWVEETDGAVRDVLADVPDHEIAAVAARWARAEEWHGATGEELRPLVEDLVRLARQARAEGERLYCWICL